jgi:hypothetical protein
MGSSEQPRPATVARADTTSPIVGGLFEASGVAHVPGTNSVLFVDDGRSTELFLMELDADGNQVGAATPVALNAEVTDLEGITSDGRFFYVVGSQSKKIGFEGDGLVRFTFDPATRSVAAVERIQGLKAWLAANVPELVGTANMIGDDVLNIEGLAWDPANKRLLLGLRAPQNGVDALLLPIKLVDTARAFTSANLRFDGPTIGLDLAGGGVRSIEFDHSRGAFNIIAGAGLNDENRDFQIFEWAGQQGAPVTAGATFPRELKPEGYTRAMIGGRSMGVIVFDVGRFAVLK